MQICSVKRSNGHHHHSRTRVAASDSQASCRVEALEYFQTSVQQETQHTDLEYIQESQTLTKFQIVAFPCSCVYHEMFILRY
jgi:hypothetical protein